MGLIPATGPSQSPGPFVGPSYFAKKIYMYRDQIETGPVTGLMKFFLASLCVLLV